MKRSLFLILAFSLIAVAVLASGVLRTVTDVPSLNPMTSDIPWTPILIAGGVAVVAVIVLLVLGKVQKK